MKKKNFLRNASLVALSVVMMGGSAVAFTGCGGSSDYELTVSIFGNSQDGALNEALCNAWAKEYAAKMQAEGVFPEGQEIKINFSIEENSATYFSNLYNAVSTGTAPDVFYVSPKYVKTWATAKQVLDLTPYFDQTEEMSATLADVWEDSLGFYGYSSEAGYVQGERINWDGSKFVTGSGITAGIYGLPKDYSNFGLGFNNIFFSDAMKTEYTTKLASTPRSVKGGSDNTADITFEGYDDHGVVTYATDVSADQSFDGQGHRAGDEAPIINIGIPTRYKPYNFYQFPSYEAALAGGDTVANTVQNMTNGEGYVVTLPGWPGEQFDLPEGTDYDETATYDASKGYVTYTFAEFSALTWALTYYLNTFAWDNGQVAVDSTSGTGGKLLQTGAWQNIYGNDQYDGTLYLLPWLAGNDASYINMASNDVINGTDPHAVGTESEKVSQLSLDGTFKDVDIQYGINSANYIEAYGAFLAYGSDWNGNSNMAGDTSATKPSGWEYFRTGACIFYGAGTWDASTRNETDWNYLQFRQMPEPVGEKYALYSEVKSADYTTMKTYGEANKVYSTADIYANQVVRQDKWGARMDSVGYGVNGQLAATGAGSAWKAKGAASLVQALTIDPDVQLTLTYAGSQLPNFKSQCVEMLHYQDEEYKTTGAFKDMITPEGDVNGDASKWDSTYAIAKAMVKATSSGGTISEWMTANYPNINYDKDNYGSDPMTNVDDLAYAMKVLYLVTYTEADRDLSLRMQSGLNAVRDSGMYTFTTRWIDVLEGRGTGFLMAYESKVIDSNNTEAVTALMNKISLTNIVTSKTAGAFDSAPVNKFGTPQWYCLYKAQASQDELDRAIQQEQNNLA